MKSKSASSGTSADVKRILWAVFGLNLLVAGAKFVWGVLSGSASMQADGIHSVFDSLGNVIGLIGIAIASRPADESHPYGHSKFETYGSLLIGLLLLVAAVEIGYSAVQGILNGHSDVEVTGVSFAVMAVTLVINLCVTFFERRAGNALHSEMLKADAAHTLSDALVSVGVIIGLVFVSAGFPQADAIAALVVTIFIFISAIEVFKRGIDTLSDHSRIPAEDIAEIASAFPQILEVHHIRTRGTESCIYCDLHLLVDPDTTVLRAHELGDELEDAIRKRYPNICEVLIHIEPYIDSERSLEQPD